MPSQLDSTAEPRRNADVELIPTLTIAAMLTTIYEITGNILRVFSWRAWIPQTNWNVLPTVYVMRGLQKEPNFSDPDYIMQEYTWRLHVRNQPCAKQLREDPEGPWTMRRVEMESLTAKFIVPTMLYRERRRVQVSGKWASRPLLARRKSPMIHRKPSDWCKDDFLWTRDSKGGRGKPVRISKETEDGSEETDQMPGNQRMDEAAQETRLCKRENWHTDAGLKRILMSSFYPFFRAFLLDDLWMKWNWRLRDRNQRSRGLVPDAIFLTSAIGRVQSQCISPVPCKRK